MNLLGSIMKDEKKMTNLNGDIYYEINVNSCITEGKETT